MSQFEYKQFYERFLPHIHPPDAAFFITFRLADSIPKSIIREYKVKKDWLNNELKRIGSQRSNENSKKQIESLLEFRRAWFKRFEDILDAGRNSPMWLGNIEIREVVAEKLLEDDTKKYRLDAFCIMPNHVHIVFKPNFSQTNLREETITGRPKFVSNEETLPKVMQSLKGATARRANLVLKRTGSFWETESYDHFIRDDAEFYRVIKYTLNNPVKAGLVNNWQDWAGTFLAERLRGKF
jgi:REP element-mobilizing transposase RayT